MTEQQHERSLMDELQDDPHMQVEIALADFTLRTEQLLAAAVATRPDIPMSAIAHLVNVDEDRVCRVIQGEDALRPEAFVRYLRALGYEVVMNVHPADVAAPALAMDHHRWNADLVDIYSQRSVNGEGVWETTLHRLRFEGAADAVDLEQPQYVSTHEGRTGRAVEYDQVVEVASVSYDTASLSG